MKRIELTKFDAVPIPVEFLRTVHVFCQKKKVCANKDDEFVESTMFRPFRWCYIGGLQLCRMCNRKKVFNNN